MTYQDIVDIIRNAASVVNPTGTFVHGRKTDGSLEFNGDSPWILLLEPIPTPINTQKEYVETISFPIIFVKQDSPESTNENREGLKQDMWELARTLLTQIEEEDLIQANYSSAQPEIRQLAGTLTGFSYQLNITYPYLIDCDTPPVLPPSVYLFASATSVFEGQEIELAWISYNASSVFIDNGIGNVSAVGFTTVTIEADTTFTASVSNSAGSDSVQITIDVVIACPDGTAQLKNSAGTVISTTPIPSGDTVDITAPDATAVIKDSLGNTLKSEAIPSNVSENVTINNSTVNVNKSNGNLISAVSVRAEATNSYNVADSNVSNSDDSYSVNVKATENLELPDITVTDSDGSTYSFPSAKNVTCTPAAALTVDFSVNDTTPDTNQTITFTDLTVGATKWLWDFGDGNSSTLQNPTHSYRYAGTYSVTLHADDGTVGGYESKTNYITVTLQTVFQTNIQAHYKGMAGASPSNATIVAGLVSQINDDTVNAYHLTQASAIARPTYKYPAITSGDGTVYGSCNVDTIGDTIFNAAAGFTRATGSWEIIVMKRSTIGTFAGNGYVQDGNSTPRYLLWSAANRGDYTMDNGTTATNGIGSSVGDWIIMQLYWNGASSYMQIDEFTRWSIPNNIGTVSANGAAYGRVSNTFNAFAEYAERIIYTSKPSDSDITNIIKYLKSKFGLW